MISLLIQYNGKVILIIIKIIPIIIKLNNLYHHLHYKIVLKLIEI